MRRTILLISTDPILFLDRRIPGNELFKLISVPAWPIAAKKPDAAPGICPAKLRVAPRKFNDIWIEFCPD
jgi:hypothetical protein